jgi:exopolysaccharide biosynthesis polyprenyl glycosylphosphotransferase
MQQKNRAHAGFGLFSVWVILIDLACLVLGSLIGIAFRIGREEMGTYVFDHLDGWLVFLVSVILTNYLTGNYKLQNVFSRFDIIVGWVFSMTFALFVLSITSFAWFKLLLGRGVLFYSIFSYSLVSLSLRIGFFKSIFGSELFTCRTVIIGTDVRAQDVRRTVENTYVLPAHRVVAYLHIPELEGDHERDGIIEGVMVLNVTRESIEDMVKSLNINLLVVASDDLRKATSLYPELRRLRFEGVEVLSSLNVEELYNAKIPVGLLSQETLMQVSLGSGMLLVRRFKRILDIVISLVAGIIFLPVGLLVAFLIKMTSPRSSVLYSQLRTGHFGGVFSIYKFRTMREDAENSTGPVWASPSDPRITPIGRVLRRFRLDELPQFFNVLAGDMSLVGPRPERPEICAQLEKEIPFYAERQNVMPGLTGWAQIRYPYGSTLEDTRRKLEYDLYYIKNLSLRLDLQIMLSTLRIVVFGKERSM